MLHELPLSEATTVVGTVDPGAPPALRVRPGDTVAFATASHWGGRVTPQTTLDDVVDLAAASPCAGPHTLTGPIAVEGARPGDVLAVEILDLRLGPHGYNIQFPGAMGRGLLPEDFPDGRVTHYAHDLEAGTIRLAPGVVAPLRPFLGIVAVAPADGPRHSVPPGDHGGNIDLPDIGAGATVHLPVQVDEALFFAGDAHAVQGCGEVCMTAIETTVERAEVRFELREGAPGRGTWVETPEAWITVGVDADLLEACKAATRQMIGLLGELAGLTAEDAYTVCSAAVDLSVTQVVNGVRGVHATLPKAILRG